MKLYLLLRWVSSALRFLRLPAYGDKCAQAAFAVLGNHLHKLEEKCEDELYALDDQLYYMEQAHDKLMQQAYRELKIS